MWQLILTELLTYYSWPPIYVCLIENLILKVFIKYIHVFIRLLERNEGPTFVIPPGFISPVSRALAVIMLTPGS
jgi:hypothetical protein